MVSVIVPAYNEAPRIAKAIAALRACDDFTEIIVVDDGSSDNTSEIARASGAAVLTLPSNQGKGAAMDAGVRAARSDTILFCDADMYGFDPAGVARVVEPVTDGKCDMVVGLRTHARLMRHILPIFTQMSGFRALAKERWHEIPIERVSGYQIELAINFIAKKNHWVVAYPALPGLTHTTKEIKYGFVRGFSARITMLRDVFSLYIRLYTDKRMGAKKMAPKTTTSQ